MSSEDLLKIAKEKGFWNYSEDASDYYEGEEERDLPELFDIVDVDTVDAWQKERKKKHEEASDAKYSNLSNIEKFNVTQQRMGLKSSMARWNEEFGTNYQTTDDFLNESDKDWNKWKDEGELRKFYVKNELEKRAAAEIQAKRFYLNK